MNVWVSDPLYHDNIVSSMGTYVCITVHASFNHPLKILEGRAHGVTNHVRLQLDIKNLTF